MNRKKERQADKSDGSIHKLHYIDECIWWIQSLHQIIELNLEIIPHSHQHPFQFIM